MFFDLSWSHILILLIVALVVVGPKDLPRLMRTTGRWTAKARAMADQFRKSFDEMARQSELDELREELESLRRERPLADIDRALATPVLPPPQIPISGETDGQPAPAVVAEVHE
jgi:sec-independent protein translocase protein TatB